jgi:hypothetical protein
MLGIARCLRCIWDTRLFWSSTAAIRWLWLGRQICYYFFIFNINDEGFDRSPHLAFRRIYLYKDKHSPGNGIRTNYWNVVYIEYISHNPQCLTYHDNVRDEICEWKLCHIWRSLGAAISLGCNNDVINRQRNGIIDTDEKILGMHHLRYARIWTRSIHSATVRAGRHDCTVKWNAFSTF